MFRPVRSRINKIDHPKAPQNTKQNKSLFSRCDKKIPFKAENQVYRSDTRSVQKIQNENGFKSRGKNTLLELHVNSASDSVYVSFGTSILAATQFCRLFNFNQAQFGSYMYVTNIPMIHVNVRQSYALLNMSRDGFGAVLAATENEIASVGNVPLEDIQLARKYFAFPGIGFPYAFLGECFENSEYQPRNWSISIPSACLAEQEEFEKSLKAENIIFTHKRTIDWREANEIASQLKVVSKNYPIIESTPHFIFDFLPATLSKKSSVVYVVEQYKANMAKHGIDPRVKQMSLSSDAPCNQTTFFANKKIQSTPVALEEDAQRNKVTL